MLEQSWKAKNGAENVELVWHLLVRNELHIVNSSKKRIQTRALQRAFIPTNPSFVNTWCCPRLCHRSWGYWRGGGRCPDSYIQQSNHLLGTKSLLSSHLFIEITIKDVSTSEWGWVFLKIPTHPRGSRTASQRQGCWSLEGWAVFVRQQGRKWACSGDGAAHGKGRGQQVCKAECVFPEQGPGEDSTERAVARDHMGPQPKRALEAQLKVWVRWSRLQLPTGRCKHDVCDRIRFSH